MDKRPTRKLRILADAAKYDVSCASSGTKGRKAAKDGMGSTIGAGIDRSQVYVTNAVKHFKYEQRGKRRMHFKSSTGEVKHYRWWLEKELDLVKPRLVVALGATATPAAKFIPVLKNRGPHELDGRAGFITVHPSSLLRAPDEDARREGFAAFVVDFKAARKLTVSLREAA